MIPKKIHYCWFGNNPLPDSAKKCINSWKKHLPDFEIICHNESDYNLKENTYAKEAYDNKKYAFVSDYARLKTIYDEGGIYFDVDVELVRPLNYEMLKNGFFAKENSKHINTGIGFAANKGDKSIKKMLDDYKYISFVKKDGSFDETPCPIRNTNSIKNEIKKRDGFEYIDEKPIYPRDYFAPLDFNTGLLKQTKNTYAIHLGNASWLDDKTRHRILRRNELISKYGKRVGKPLYKFKRLFGIIK